MRKTLPLLLVVLCAAGITSLEASAQRRPAELVKDYAGSHGSEFASYFDRVRLLTQQAQLEVSSRLGLIQYREGFQYPMTIHFEDGAPPGLESALAYVRYAQSNKGFLQDLVVNLDELARHPMDFDTVFYHEMTHAVMNDSVGGAASFKIPPWLQEGLAVWVSGEGDSRVKRSVERLHKSQARALVVSLDGPVTGLGYPQYYLAIKYLLDAHGINAVQGIIRELIEGKPLAEALKDCTGLSWEDYQTRVAAYSLKIFQEIAIPDHVTRS